MSTKLIKTILALLVLGLLTTVILTEKYPIEISKIMIFCLQSTLAFFFGYFIGELLFTKKINQKYEK